MKCRKLISVVFLSKIFSYFFRHVKAVFTALPKIFAKYTKHFRSNSGNVYLLNFSSEKKFFLKPFLSTKRTQILRTLPEIQLGSEKSYESIFSEEKISSKNFSRHPKMQFWEPAFFCHTAERFLLKFESKHKTFFVSRFVIWKLLLGT